jgi:WD40 repeat protein
LIASFDSVIRRFELPTGRELSTREHHRSQIVALALSLNGRLIASADHGQTLQLLDDELGVVIWRAAAPVRALAFSPDGRRLAVADGGLRVCEVRTGDEVASLLPVDHGDPFHGHGAVAWSPDGMHLAAGICGAPSQLVVWHDLAELAVWLELPGDRFTGPNAVAFSPSGRRIATAHGDGELHLWAWPTGEHVTSVRGRWESLHAVAFLDEQRVAAVGRDVDGSPPVGVWAIP